MIKNISFIVLFFLNITCFAQNWITDFVAAKQEANEKNQNIVLVFSGSDWCAPCMKLEREIWDSEIFKASGKSSFVL